jgi:hypothetical protein
MERVKRVRQLMERIVGRVLARLERALPEQDLQAQELATVLEQQVAARQG